MADDQADDIEAVRRSLFPTPMLGVGDDDEWCLARRLRSLRIASGGFARANAEATARGAIVPGWVDRVTRGSVRPGRELVEGLMARCEAYLEGSDGF
jgi:hypothetical protein